MNNELMKIFSERILCE